MDSSVAALRSQNRLLRHLLLASWGIVILLACASFGRSTDDKLSVKELRLVDDAGRARGILGIHRDPADVDGKPEPFLHLLDGNGQDVASLEVHGFDRKDPERAVKFGSLDLYNTSDRPLVDAGVLGHRGFRATSFDCKLRGGDGKCETEILSGLITVSTRAPSKSGDGWLMMMGFLDPDAPSPTIRLRDPSSGSASIIGCADLVTPKTGEKHTTGAGSLVLFGPDGSVMTKLP